jgi:hypothetical protein
MVIRNQHIQAGLPARSVAFKPAGLVKPEPPVSAPQEQLQLSGSAPARPFPAPTLKQLASPDPLAEIKASVATWMAENAPAADQREVVLWQGLAQWRAGVALDTAKPEWQGLHQNKIQSARNMWDLADEVHAVRDPKAQEGEFSSYRIERLAGKSRFLMAMLAAQVGQDTLAQAFDAFIAQRGGLATSATDLLAALPAINGRPAADLLMGWLDQPHFPKLGSALVQDGRDAKLKVSQESWKLYPDTKGEFDQSWSIPLTVKFQDDEGVKTLQAVIDPETSSVSLPSKGKVRWFYPNGGGAGMLRTSMTEQDQEALKNEGFQHLSSAEKFALVANQWRLVRHGEVNVGSFLDLAVMAAKDADDDMLALLCTEARYLGSYRTTPEDKADFEKLTHQLLRPGLDRIGERKVAGEPPYRQQLRQTVLSLLATSKEPKATAMVATDLARYRAGQPVDSISNDLDARNWGCKIADPTVIAEALTDLRDGVGNGMSGSDIFDKATVALRSPDPLVRGQVMTLLTKVSADQGTGLWAIGTAGRQERETAFAYLEQNWSKLELKEDWIRALHSTTDRERLHGFLQSHADPATWTHYQQNIRQGEGRYMTSVAPDLTNWLRERNDSAGPQLGWLIA